MFCLNREENGNSNSNSNSNSFIWYSSWEPSTCSTLVNASNITTTMVESDAGNHHRRQQLPWYGGDASHMHPDPHLTCLNLGKRHYFEETNNNNVVNVATTLGERHVCGGGGFALQGNNNKKAKSFSGRVGAAGGEKMEAVVPRCQVEGCHVALLNAKEYHKRHKVCDMHSKAPKVVVLGLEQRFCQQCSRFHVVSEFDDSKRSCRRRLAGHNERRRKSSCHSVAGDSTQGCALSLLSSGSDPWFSHSDFPIRCSAALRELIAENRATLMTRQLVFDRDLHLPHHVVEDFKEVRNESNYFPQQMFP